MAGDGGGGWRAPRGCELTLVSRVELGHSEASTRAQAPAASGEGRGRGASLSVPPGQVLCSIHT